MNEFLKKMLTNLTTLWGKWSLVQRAVLIGIVVAVIAGIAALLSVSSAPNLIPVIDAPIRDEAARDRIVVRINQEGIRPIVNAAGLVQVTDEAVARRMRAILIREDLIPTGTDPWAIFDVPRWTTTDYERNINFQRAIKETITNHIKAIDDVDDANVTLTFPERELFASQQQPVKASVIIIPKPGSDITENRKKVEGIQKLLKFAVDGLNDENIVITDQSGLILNDFAGMAAMDRQNLIERENKFIQQLEAKYRAEILRGLQSTFSPNRVRDLNIKIDMDMSKKAVDTREFFPITIKPRTPGLAYDDSEIVQSIPRSKSESDTEWQGTGYNPEGPPALRARPPRLLRICPTCTAGWNRKQMSPTSRSTKRTPWKNAVPRLIA